VTEKKKKKKPTIGEDLRRLRRYAAIAGMVLAIVCHIVPPKYRAACDALASICTGG